MSADRNNPRRDRFKPRVESLEDRTALSGNVQAAVIGGVLTLSGDDAANQIVISGTGKHSVMLRSLDGTTINGQTSLYVGGIEGGLNVRMGGGDDNLTIFSLRAGGLNVDLGDGNDSFAMTDADYRAGTEIRAGAGDDIVSLHGSGFRRYVFVDTGTGNDVVVADTIGVRDMGMVNPGGTDFFDRRSSVLLLPSITGFRLGSPTELISPSVTLTTDAAEPFNTPTLIFTATFSEDVTGFSATGVTVTNGTVSDFAQVDAQTYTITITPTGQGVVSATVNAGAAIDAVGNANTASATVSRTFDSLAPATPTLDLAAASDTGAIGDLRTEQSTVMLVGNAEAGSTITLYRATAGTAPGSGTPAAITTAVAGGTFTLSGITLDLGPNSFVVTATDAAGNVSVTFAQTFTRNAPPTVAAPIADQNGTAGGADVQVDISAVFADAERVVRLAVMYPTGQTGAIDINLFETDAPQTVTNFVSRVNNVDPTKDYDGTIFHRLAPGFVLQGGGFEFNAAGTDTATTFPTTADTPPTTVPNEPSVSNTRGTLAMAKAGTTPSVSNEFFFNLSDNSANLDVQSGGFTVFGQVMNGGQQALDAMVASLNTFNGDGLPGAPPFPVAPGADTSNFPLNLTAADLASVTTAAELSTTQKLIFTVVGTSDANVATASITGSTLSITPVATGTATITIRATDLDGSSVTTTVNITVA